MNSQIKAQQKLRQWREEPIRFVVDELHIEPDKWQAEVLRLFPSQNEREKRISMQACAGPGKSLLLAACGLNFLTCYGAINEHPQGAVVAVTGDNLKSNLWPKFAELMNRSEYLKRVFKWTKERIYAVDHPETWFLGARSWSKDANPEEQGRTLSGLHAKRVLFLMDESGEIPLPVMRSAEQALSNCTWGKIMQAGNPTSHEGMLYAAATKFAHIWTVVRITGDPEDPNRSPRVDLQWAKEQIALYGRDNPWVMAYILGQFPNSAINSLLSIEDVDHAIKRLHRPEQLEGSQKRLGIDVAREGLDKTVLFPRWGLQAYKPVEMSHSRGHDVAARAALAKQKWEWEMCFVDDTGGYGGSVCDSFVQSGIDHVPVNFGSHAIDPRYFNRRSEMLFLMADWVKAHGALPDLPELRSEMPALKYTFKAGKMMVIEKDQIKKMIGRSPDYTDALALTFALPEMPSRAVAMAMGGVGSRSASDFDPYALSTKPQEDEMAKFMAGVW